MSNTTYLLSKDTLKTIAQGALGAMTFGAYHQFTTNKMMEMNNEKQTEIMKMNNEIQDIKHKTEMNEMKNNYKTEIDKLTEKINNLEKRRFWF